MSDPDLAAVASSRARLWDCGFRPVPVYTVEAGRRAGHDKPGKHPAGAGWQLAARRDPPTAALALPDRDTANTGILCDGLRVVDLDIDNATLAHRCTALAREMLGEAPTRFRANSPRRLLVYRAAEGEPPKKVSLARWARSRCWAGANNSSRSVTTRAARCCNGTRNRSAAR